MLTVESIDKSYGHFRAVSDVSFELAKGQVVGLLGPNGAGKTTSIRMMTGFFPPDRGSIRVNGHDTVEASAQARHSLGYLPENAPLYPEMSVDGLLRFRARLYGLSRGQASSAIAHAADRCALRDVLHRRIGQLSKGYRQRVGLAAAILHNPPVLVLDEPANGLDPTQITQMRSLIAELAIDRTVLVSSHILAEVERTCSRVLIMIRGRLRADGDPKVLTSRHVKAATATVVEVSHVSDASVLARVLGALPGVASVQPLTTLGRTTGARILGTSASDPAPGLIAASIASAGLELVAINPERPTLESVFLDLLESEAA